MTITRRPVLTGAAAASLMAANAYAQSAADFVGEWKGVFQRGEAIASGRKALTLARLAELRAASGTPAMAAAALNRDGRRVALVDGVRAVGQPQRVTENDKWHLGSITKSMTSTLIARLAQTGAVSWDDTVGGVLGGLISDMRADYSDVTFRHLLSHRGGAAGEHRIDRPISLSAKER